MSKNNVAQQTKNVLVSYSPKAMGSSEEARSDHGLKGPREKRDPSRVPSFRQPVVCDENTIFTPQWPQVWPPRD